jgi:ribosomal protein S18 acetylase RimI-like enzyme
VSGAAARTEIQAPRLNVERVTELHEDDLSALCEATNAAILDGGGFGWVNPPGQQALERYFRGVMLVPERELFVGIMHSFVAPFARGNGLARLMMLRIEDRARTLNYRVLNLDVRETQEAAITLYESLGYERWGVHPHYARVRGQTVRGFFYMKSLRKGAAEAPGFGDHTLPA